MTALREVQGDPGLIRNSSVLDHNACHKVRYTILSFLPQIEIKSMLTKLALI